MGSKPFSIVASSKLRRYASGKLRRYVWSNREVIESQSQTQDLVGLMA